MNVIQFPKNPRVVGLHTKLHTMMKPLDAVHREIKAINLQLQKAKTRANTMQDEYDKVLLDYAQRVGPENVTTREAEYGTAVKIRFNDSGEIETYVE